MVTALDPEAFLSGKTGVGTPLPHAQVEVDAHQRVLVRANSLLLDYLPSVDGFSRDPFVMGDLGKRDASGNLTILGRSDRVINTGGEKVHPEQVEAAAIASGLVCGAHCRGCPDTDWGTRVELECSVRSLSDELEQLIRQSLEQHLPAYAVPKVIRIYRRQPKDKK